jgi:hypothetical protein
MKKYLMTASLMILSFLLMAQEEEKPKYTMVEHVIINVKPGTQGDFEKAVKAHNEAHHNGAHNAWLMKVETGKNAGTYIWGMGPCTFTDLDSRPTGGAHDEDWANNVGTHIESVDGVEYWRKMDKLSYTKADEEWNMLNIWTLDIKRGEWYRFKSFMEKVQPIFEEKDETNNVWSKQFNENDGKDAAIVWRMKSWADMDNQDWNMKEEYDKKYGEGSWDDALEEWEDFVESMTSQVWSVVR